MHRDEGDVPAAHEKAGSEVEIAGVLAGLGERLADGLLALARGLHPTAQAARREYHRDRTERQQRERALPAVGRQERLADRRQEELAERAHGRGDAERDRPALRRHASPDRRQDHAEPGPAQAQTDQDFGAEIQLGRAAGGRHQVDTDDVEQAAADDGARRAPLVRDRADERLRQSPEQVLDRHREREHFAAPAEIEAHRLQEQAEARADAERQQHDERAARDRAHGGARQLLEHQAPLQSAALAGAIVGRKAASVNAAPCKAALPNRSPAARSRRHGFSSILSAVVRRHSPSCGLDDRIQPSNGAPAGRAELDREPG